MIAVDGALRREYRIVIIGYDETVQLNEKSSLARNNTAESTSGKSHGRSSSTITWNLSLSKIHTLLSGISYPVCAIFPKHIARPWSTCLRMSAKMDNLKPWRRKSLIYALFVIPYTYTCSRFSWPSGKGYSYWPDGSAECAGKESLTVRGINGKRHSENGLLGLKSESCHQSF